ncbi:MAG TPA: DUF6338 family protein [Longimicrobiaceae bacterium]
MTAALNGTTVMLFMATIFPGLISTAVYRLLMPARALEWTTALLQGLFYSVVNLVLALPILFFLVFGRDPLVHPVRYSAAALLVLLVLPVIWPVLLVRLFKSRFLSARIQIPYPTAWDFFFDQREPAFVLVHLASGALLAGYWGSNSWAGSHPNDGDMYLEAVYKLSDDGTLGERVANTRGVLLRKEQYDYIELFAAPGR